MKGAPAADQEPVVSILRKNLCVPKVPGISRPGQPPGTGEDIVTPRQTGHFHEYPPGGRPSGGAKPRECAWAFGPQKIIDTDNVSIAASANISGYKKNHGFMLTNDRFSSLQRSFIALLAERAAPGMPPPDATHWPAM